MKKIFFIIVSLVFVSILVWILVPPSNCEDGSGAKTLSDSKGLSFQYPSRFCTTPHIVGWGSNNLSLYQTPQSGGIASTLFYKKQALRSVFGLSYAPDYAFIAYVISDFSDRDMVPSESASLTAVSPNFETVTDGVTKNGFHYVVRKSVEEKNTPVFDIRVYSDKLQKMIFLNFVEELLSEEEVNELIESIQVSK